MNTSETNNFSLEKRHGIEVAEITHNKKGVIETLYGKLSYSIDEFGFVYLKGILSWGGYSHDITTMVLWRDKGSWTVRAFMASVPIVDGKFIAVPGFSDVCESVIESWRVFCERGKSV